jgi:hypothetical protein
VNAADFAGPVGPDDIHDSTIVAVERTNRIITVHLRALHGRQFSIEFLGVASVSALQPENMFLRALTEMPHSPPLRRFVFANADESSIAYLEIVAERFTVSPPNS